MLARVMAQAQCTKYFVPLPVRVASCESQRRVVFQSLPFLGWARAMRAQGSRVCHHPCKPHGGWLAGSFNVCSFRSGNLNGFRRRHDQTAMRVPRCAMRCKGNRPSQQPSNRLFSHLSPAATSQSRPL